MCLLIQLTENFWFVSSVRFNITSLWGTVKVPGVGCRGRGPPDTCNRFYSFYRTHTGWLICSFPNSRRPTGICWCLVATVPAITLSTSSCLPPRLRISAWCLILQMSPSCLRAFSKALPCSILICSSTQWTNQPSHQSSYQWTDHLTGKPTTQPR